jgi:hypothetical protein
LGISFSYIGTQEYFFKVPITFDKKLSNLDDSSFVSNSSINSSSRGGTNTLSNTGADSSLIYSNTSSTNSFTSPTKPVNESTKKDSENTSWKRKKRKDIFTFDEKESLEDIRKRIFSWDILEGDGEEKRESWEEKERKRHWEWEKYKIYGEFVRKYMKLHFHVQNENVQFYLLLYIFFLYFLLFIIIIV